MEGLDLSCRAIEGFLKGWVNFFYGSRDFLRGYLNGGRGHGHGIELMGVPYQGCIPVFFNIFKDALDRGVGPLPRAAAGAVRDRDEPRTQRGQPRPQRAYRTGDEMTANLSQCVGWTLVWTTLPIASSCPSWKLSRAIIVSVPSSLRFIS